MFSAADAGRQVLLPCVQTIEAHLRDFSPFHIITIPQNGGPPSGRNFRNDITSATAFIVGMNEQCNNVYFTVNIVDGAFEGHKPTKQDIVQYRTAHVDIDPYKIGSAFDKAAALQAVKEDLPTLVIDSGNGIHAYWQFAEPVPATPENLAALETLNRALVARFGGDPAAVNVDRVLRVPGTVNWPNEKKRALGRIPCLAMVLP